MKLSVLAFALLPMLVSTSNAPEKPSYQYSSSTQKDPQVSTTKITEYSSSSDGPHVTTSVKTEIVNNGKLCFSSSYTKTTTNYDSECEDSSSRSSGSTSSATSDDSPGQGEESSNGLPFDDNDVDGNINLNGAFRDAVILGPVTNNRVGNYINGKLVSNKDYGSWPKINAQGFMAGAKIYGGFEGGHIGHSINEVGPREVTKKSRGKN